MDQTSCLTKGICCTIAQYSQSFGGWKIEVFRASIVSITLISIIFLIFKLRDSHHSHLAVYPRFIQTACITFIIVVICYIFGEPDRYHVAFSIIYTCALSAQWWIQLAVPVFMFQKNTGRKSIQKTVMITSLMTTILLFFPLFFIVWKENKWIGTIITEGALVLVFLVVCVLSLYPRYLRRRCNQSEDLPTTPLLVNEPSLNIEDLNQSDVVRPAALLWSVFQCVAHILFLVNYLLLVLQPRQEAAKCMTVVSDMVYYILYAPLLWFTLTSDSSYWKEKGVVWALRKTTVKEINAGSGGLTKLRFIPSSEIILKQAIGSGGYGEVFRGEWHEINVAVKRLKLRIDSSDDESEDLFKEAKMIASLNHPNIIQFFGVAAEPDNMLLITEYVEKGSIYDLLHNPSSDGNKFRSSWSLRFRAMIDITKALLELHSHQPIIIHRDMKSSNCLVDKNWNTKVCDFGVSRIIEKSANFTQIGTPQWCAPEVFGGNKYNEKADIFSFGVVMWELLTLEIPFDGIYPFRMVTMVSHEGYRLPIPDCCPEPLRNLITQCWDSEPSNRPDAANILSRLEQMSNFAFEETFQKMSSCSKTPEKSKQFTTDNNS